MMLDQRPNTVQPSPDIRRLMGAVCRHQHQGFASWESVYDDFFGKDSLLNKKDRRKHERQYKAYKRLAKQAIDLGYLKSEIRDGYLFYGLGPEGKKFIIKLREFHALPTV